MDRKLALLLAIPVMGAFSFPALAGWNGDHANGQHRHAVSRQHHPHRASEVRLRASMDAERNHERQRVTLHGFMAADNSDSERSRGREDGGLRHSNDNRDGNGDRNSGRGGDRYGDRDGGHYGDGDRGGDRRGGDDRYRRDRDRDRYRPYPWHRERYERDSRMYWRFNMSLFPRYDLGIWRGGYWHHGWYNDRWGWWWIVGGIWYYYPAPIYPYPNPYIPGAVVVINNQSDTPTPPAEAPTQFWYHCSSPQGYYPYVPECPAGWTRVAASPSNGTMPASPPPQSPAPAPAPAPAQSPAPVQYWYHCKSPQGYYPYVKTCPGGWERVPATPPSTSSSKPPGGGK